MKKLISLSTFVVLFLLILISCDPKEIIIPELNITGGNELTITDEGGSSTLSFYTNVAWSVSVSDTKATDWITVSPASGVAGSVSVSVNVNKNEDYEDRTAYLKIVAEDQKGTVTVTQKKKGALTLSPERQEIPQEGKTIDIELKTNLEYDIIIPTYCSEWITPVKTKAIETYNLQFKIEANTDLDSRQGEIIIKDKNSTLADTVKVLQAYKDGLILTQRTYDIESDGKTIDVELKSNVEFDEIFPSGVTWIKKVETKSLQTYSLKYEISENETHDSRTAKIIYKDKNSDLADTLTITQYQKDAIILGQKSYDVEMTGGTIDLKVSSNIEFEVIIPSPENDWITQVDTKAMTDSDLKFEVKNNPNYDSRSGKIVIKDKNSTLADTVVVKQILSGIILSSKNISIVRRASDHFIILNPDVNYSILPFEFDWIENIYQSPPFGSIILLKDNALNERRKGYAVFEDLDTFEKDTLWISQLPSTDVVLNEDLRPKLPSTGGEIEIFINPEVKNWECNMYGSYYISKEIASQGPEYLKIKINPRNPGDDYSDDTAGIQVQVRDLDRDIYCELYLSVSAALPYLSQSEFFVDSNKDTIKTTITDPAFSSAFFSVEQFDWARKITVDNPEPNASYFEIDPNTSVEKRTGLINIFGGTPGTSQFLYIEQEGQKGISPTQSSYAVDASGGTLKIPVKSSIRYNITNPTSDWIRYVGTSSSLGSDILEYLISPNATSGNRSAKIVLSDSNSGINETITINQSTSGGFIISSKDLEISSIGGVIDIELCSETDMFDININDPWIIQINTKSLNSYTLTFNIEANPSIERSSGIIFVNRNDNTIKDTVDVTQLSNTGSINKEKEALIALYNATSGDNWSNKTNWCSNEPLSSWYGVTLDNNGNVIKLDLSGNNLSGKIPDIFGSLRRLKYLNLQNNSLYGEILKYLTNNNNLEEIVLLYNFFTGEIPENISNLNRLKNISLTKNLFSGTIPETLCDIISLETILLSDNNFTGHIPDNIGNLINLKQLYIESCKLSGGLPDSFINIMDNPGIYINLTNNYLSGTIPLSIVNHPLWSMPYELSILTQRDGYGFDIEAYKSTDFSKDKEVLKLYSATKGNGIPLIIIGDGFVDTLVTNGTYESAVNRTIDYYFNIEPVKSLKEYFDIYMVTAVSTNNNYGFKSCDTPLKVMFGSDGRYMRGDNDKVLEYASLVPDYNADYSKIIVMTYSDKTGGTAYYIGDSRTSIAYCSKTNNGFDSEEFRYLIQHEAVGHGLGLLADEYYITGTIDEAAKTQLRAEQALGRFLNVDITNNPNDILWAKFLNDNRYINEDLGIFEGGYANYDKGVWRPSQTSIMIAHGPWFNAPSRESIYIQVMKIAFGDSWQYDYETFVEFDLKL